MSNHIGVRKTIYFAQDSTSLKAVESVVEATGQAFSTCVHQLINHGIEPYLEAVGTQLPLPLPEEGGQSTDKQFDSVVKNLFPTLHKQEKSQ